MFKERCPQNFRAYATVCEAGDIRIGRMFVTATGREASKAWPGGAPAAKRKLRLFPDHYLRLALNASRRGKRRAPAPSLLLNRSNVRSGDFYADKG